MAKVAVYCRVSTQAQEDNTSLGNQEEMGRNFCQLNGFEPIVFRDASSGANFDREKFLDLWQMMSSGDLAGVWFWKVDRLLRDMGVFNQFVLHAKQTESRLWFSGQEIDVNDIAGYAMLAYQSVGATVERLSILDRTSKGRLSKYKKGELFNGKPPFGFERRSNEGKGKIFPNDEKLFWVKEVFRVVLLDSINKNLDIIKHLKRLHGDKLPLLVNDANVRRWLRNTVYIGEAVNRTDNGSFIYKVDPIVSIDQWERVLEKLANMGKIKGKRTNVYLLQNKSFCGTCEREMWLQGNKAVRKGGIVKHYVYYTCKRTNSKARDDRFSHFEYTSDCTAIRYNRIAVSDLEDVVWEVLFKNILPNAEVIRTEWQKKFSADEESKNEFKGRLKYYSKEVEKKQTAVDNMTVLLAEGTIDKLQYNRTVDVLKKEILDLNTKLSEVTKEFERVNNLPKLNNWFEQLEVDLNSKYGLQRRADKQRLLNKYVKGVYTTLKKDGGLNSKVYEIVVILNISFPQRLIELELNGDDFKVVVGNKYNEPISVGYE